MKNIKLGLLPKVALAIVLGIVCGIIFPDWMGRIFVTISQLFGNFLNFFIPLLIFGLITPGISDIGKEAGRLLLLTVTLAYGFTLFSGFFSYFSSVLVFPVLLSDTDRLMSADASSASALLPYFNIDMPPLMTVMTALILAFTVGIGMSLLKTDALKQVMNDFKEIVNLFIHKLIIPLLPVYILGIFWNMTATGQIFDIIGLFIKIIVVIFFMTFILLLIQFTIAGIIGRRNPWRLLRNMMPAYITALGTQSSAATIPVTVEQTRKNEVDEDIVDFVIPLCATIHLSGSTLKIVSCSLAIMMTTGIPYSTGLFTGFIFMLGITMVAAPGVPGGAIMASLGLLQSMLGFDETACALMIALYIAMDSFGTACNVTGDGSIAIIINKIYKNKKK
jgi:Na+/H+-dicarboxylate symporters